MKRQLLACVLALTSTTIFNSAMASELDKPVVNRVALPPEIPRTIIMRVSPDKTVEVAHVQQEITEGTQLTNQELSRLKFKTVDAEKKYDAKDLGAVAELNRDSGSGQSWYFWYGYGYGYGWNNYYGGYYNPYVWYGGYSFYYPYYYGYGGYAWGGYYYNYYRCW